MAKFGRILVAANTSGRRLVMVVDVGAGTTDFGAFVVVSNGSRSKIHPLEGAFGAIRQAGDTIDQLLETFIYEKSGIDVRTSEGMRVRSAVLQRKRAWKETLFKTKRLTYTLANDSEGEISLLEFLERPGVREFGRTLEKEFTRFAELTGKGTIGTFSTEGVLVVLTGGGSSLPMVTDLARGQFSAFATRLNRASAPEAPAEIEDPDLRAEYPQLAVAFGGSVPELPEVRKPIAEVGGLPQPTVVVSKPFAG